MSTKKVLKKMRLMISICCLLVSQALLAKVNHTIYTEDASEVKSSLVQVQKQIQKLEKTVYHSQHQEKTLTQQLAAIEKEIGDNSETLRELENKMLTHRQTLHRLQKEEENLALNNQIHQAQLSKLMQTTFQHHHKEKLKLIFAPNEMSNLARLNQYYQFFYNAESQRISVLQENLQHVQQLRKDILEEQQQVKLLSLNLTTSQAQLSLKKDKRKNVLSALSKELSHASHQLSQLQQQEQHLAELFKMLQNKLSTTPTYIEPSQEFAKMKHRLNLPIKMAGAKLSTLANLKKVSAKKTYIDAPAGTSVNAIFGGRVVFSEWLRNIGLLIIVDHGNGFMSLYGNNQKLYKSLGDWVDEGEMIARVGQSGGHTQPGLYFEIRKNGEALNPTPWFKEA